MESHALPITLDGLEPVTLHYLTYGTPNKPVVFCAHALTCNAHDFDYLAAALAEEFYVVAVDMPGRGKSSHLGEKAHYTNDNHLRWAFALLDHLKIERVHWVGASMGGIMGMMACAERPALVASLMLNDVGSVLAKEGLAEIANYSGKPLPVGNNTALEAQLKENFAPFAFSKEEYWQHFFTHRVYVHEDGIYMLRNDAAIVAPLRDMVLVMEEVQDISLEPFWDAVQCPVLLFRGAESLLLRADTAQTMAEKEDAQVTLHTFPGVGHMPNLREEDQITIVREWLQMQA